MDPGQTRASGGIPALKTVTVVVVLSIWASGAIAQMLSPRQYHEPWWIHAIALYTISYALTGRFVQARIGDLIDAISKRP